MAFHLENDKELKEKPIRFGCVIQPHVPVEKPSDFACMVWHS